VRGSVYAGVDLSATAKRETAVCVVRVGTSVEFFQVRTDVELLEVLARASPRLVAIDAPLTLPSTGKGLRLCDAEVRRMGVPILPPAMGPMRMLSERGARFAGLLRERGMRVIEVYPRGAQRTLGLIGRGERPSSVVAQRIASLLGVRVAEGLGVDEIDALTCALVAFLHDVNKTVELGDPEEGTIVMPSPEAMRELRRLLRSSEG
jgi:predicted nuclease with RNAse H fold